MNRLRLAVNLAIVRRSRSSRLTDMPLMVAASQFFGGRKLREQRQKQQQAQNDDEEEEDPDVRREREEQEALEQRKQQEKASRAEAYWEAKQAKQLENKQFRETEYRAQQLEKSRAQREAVQTTTGKTPLPDEEDSHHSARDVASKRGLRYADHEVSEEDQQKMSASGDFTETEAETQLGDINPYLRRELHREKLRKQKTK
jgi:hypothetical protein